MKALFNILLGISLFTLFSGATKLINQQDPIAGTWKGTSICQQKQSPCNDETVIYHITKASTANRYQFVMNKIVNGVEEEMGVFDFIYDPAKNTLICHSVNRFDSLWKFDLKNNIMYGTLTVDKKTLYRIIKVVKI